MATTCRLIHSDLSGDGTFYETGLSTTWSPGLTNLQNPLLSAIARTTTLSNARFGLLFSSGVVASGCAIVGTNLTKNATFRVTATAISPSATAYDSGTLPVSTTTK